MNRQQLTLLLLVSLTLNAACGSGGSASKNAETKSAPSPAPATPTITVTAVLSQELNRRLRLPGELQPYQDVMLYPKVQGFIEWIGVDRGSVVKSGQLLVRLSAPEIGSQRNEAEAKVGGAQAQKLEAEARVSTIIAQRVEAEARLAASAATYNRLRSASATPGVVSGNELENAQRLMEAEQARVQAYKETEKAALAQVKAIAETETAARAAARSMQTTENYLRIVAPFSGVITERNAHKGSLAGPAGAAAAQPVLRMQEVSRLRLVVPVPEAEVAAVKPGTKVSFTLPAFPGETFTGAVARIGSAIDAKTRTLPVELDVSNPARKLTPGMYPQVIWPSSRPRPSLLVPPSAVATTTEKSFVIRIRDGVTEWVDVKRGASINQQGNHQGTDLVEVFGDLAEGEQIALRGTDELRAGTRVQTKAAPQPQGK
ncbi:MAG: efflux RND transporter periplasmic adaptor subunit [Blastocatellales bacterium]|nr:efflux RND transporter periplasmic adaptor subunit [Acidobacteriota bacterium]